MIKTNPIAILFDLNADVDTASGLTMLCQLRGKHQRAEKVNSALKHDKVALHSANIRSHLDNNHRSPIPAAVWNKVKTSTTLDDAQAKLVDKAIDEKLVCWAFVFVKRAS